MPLTAASPKRMFAVLDREAELALVDVRRQDLDAHLVALADVLDDLGRRPALGLGGQQGGQEMDGVMGLEVGRLVGQEGVGGAVGLVEAVLGELLDLLEDLVGLGLADALLLGPLDELLLLGLHRLLVLLAHGLAQDVGPGQGEPGQVGGDAHDLFLVDDDARASP